jgi:hypothetical protein
VAFDDLILATDRAVQTHLGGVAVCYAPAVGPSVTTTPDGDPLVGMFDENYVVATSEFNGVETVAPAIVLLLEDLPSDPNDDEPKLTILGKLYSVRLRSTDGTIGGSIRLVLRRADL